MAITFTAVTGAGNPLNGVDVGIQATINFVDIDGDGDKDVFLGSAFYSPAYYKNTGTALAPAYLLQTGASNPANGYDNGYGGNGYTSPTFADIDADGDMDLFIGTRGATANYYYKNTGTATAPVFVEQTAGVPVAGLALGAYVHLAFVDIDSDGDLDLFSGEIGGTLSYFKNTGTARVATFVQQTGASNLFNGIDVGDRSTINFVDLDHDGDLDALSGDYNGAIHYFKNTGTAVAPAFLEQTGASNPFNGIDVGYYAKPTFADADGDGDLDLFVGAMDGTVFYYRNDSTPLANALVERTGAANPFNGVSLGLRSTPVFADLDGDGDMDMFGGSTNGTLFYYKNTGTAIAPSFLLTTGASDPVNGVYGGTHASLAFADIDSDGDLDLLIGEEGGTFFYFRNTGTAIAPAFQARTGASNPLNGIDIGANANPVFIDINNDGDLDIFVGADNGTIKYYANTGTPTAPAYLVQTGAANPFNGVDVGNGAYITFIDYDGDGDKDAVIGDSSGTFTYYRNTGTLVAPAFLKVTGASDPFNGQDLGSSSAPNFVDVDKDGDLDVFIGLYDGSISYFENTANTSAAPSASPVNSVPAAQTTNEDTAKVFSVGGGNLISVSDADSTNLQITLTVAHGAITLSGTTGLTFTAGDGTADATMTFTGTATNINTALAGLSYAPTANYNGSDTLTILSDDDTTAGTGNTDSDTVGITVTSVNDTPVNTVPAAQTTNEDTAKVFSVGGGNLISVSDVDSTNLQITLTVAHGAITLSGVTGLTFTAGDGTSDATMTFTGTATNINTALAGLSYAPTANYNGSDTLTILSDDDTTAGTGATDTDTVALTVTAVNDAPVNTVPGAQTTNEDTAKVFSVGGSNLISINDVDATNQQITLSVVHGAITLSGTTGLTFTTGDGTADATMTFTGTQANINTALAGLSYAPTANYSGSDTLTILTDDDTTGATGLTDSDTIGITVTAINDAPVNTLPATYTTNQDAALVVTGISISDVDNATPVSVVLGIDHGILTLSTAVGGGLTAGMIAANGSTSVTITGATLSQINATLADAAGLSFTPTTSYNGTATLTLTTDDGTTTDVDTSTLTISALGGGGGGGGGGGTNIPASTLVIEGTNDADSLFGTPQNDTIIGNNGADTINGAMGNDLLNGNNGDDFLRGGKDQDTLSGDAGNDSLLGDLGDDSANGNSGNDTINGNTGNDTLRGGQGDDLVYGGKDNDVIMGDLGNDTLLGNLGNDTLTGGAGADRFLYANADGNDLITDFNGSEGDRLVIAAGLNYSVTTEGGSVILHFDGGSSLTLQGVASLNNDWVIQ